MHMCRRYYNACQGPAWEVVLGSAGHFQFLDEQSMLQRAVCAVGPVEDSSVREVAQVRLAFDFFRQSRCNKTSIPCFSCLVWSSLSDSGLSRLHFAILV